MPQTVPEGRSPVSPENRRLDRRPTVPESVPATLAAPAMPGVEADLADAAETDVSSQADKPWVTVVWNDPVNLMPYVTWVFQKLFGYSHEKAEKLMLDVHHKGKAIVSSGMRERMEYDASRLHGYGLWATVDHP